MSNDSPTQTATTMLHDASREELEAALIDQGCLVAKLNRDGVILQQAMMEIWPIASDEVKAIVERTMAATGMPKVAP